MLHALNATLAPAVMQRLTLALNHVIAAEPVAAQRLTVHAGRCVQFDLLRWPQVLPEPPTIAFRITPAGLLEWVGEAPVGPVDLRIGVPAHNPAALLARLALGEAPLLDVHGDPALASELRWLLDNLRWDAEADLARIFDPRIAHELARAARALGGGLRAALRGAGELAARWRPGRA